MTAHRPQQETQTSTVGPLVVVEGLIEIWGICPALAFSMFYHNGAVKWSPGYTRSRAGQGGAWGMLTGDCLIAVTLEKRTKSGGSGLCDAEVTWLDSCQPSLPRAVTSIGLVSSSSKKSLWLFCMTGGFLLSETTGSRHQDTHRQQVSRSAGSCSFLVRRQRSSLT